MSSQFVENKSVNKMTPEELAGNTGNQAVEHKEAVLSYMRKFPPSAFTSQPVIDRLTGEVVYEANNARSDGVFTWYEAEIYHFERYNLKLSDAFIQHVLSQAEAFGNGAEQWQYAVDQSVDEMIDSYGEISQEELANYTDKEPPPDKEVILTYMRNFPPCLVTSAPVTDRLTGEKAGAADNGRSDGTFVWYESWIYYFERYNLKLSDAFIQHVRSQTAAQMRTVEE